MTLSIALPPKYRASISWRLLLPERSSTWLTGLADAIAAGVEIDIPGVGTLRTETIADRLDHHPSTGAAITVPSSASVTFRPAS